MVGDQGAGLEGHRGLDALGGGHRVGLVGREEGDVDGAEGMHLLDVFRVAGHIDPQPVKIQDIAVVPPLGVELEMVFGDVVGRDGDQADGADAEGVAVGDRLAAAQQGLRSGVEEHAGAVFGQEADGFGIEVVAVLVGDQDTVCLGECRIVDFGGTHLQDGVDLDAVSFVVHREGAVVDHRDFDFVPVGRGEPGGGEIRLRGAGNGGREGEEGIEKLGHKS